MNVKQNAYVGRQLTRQVGFIYLQVPVESVKLDLQPVEQEWVYDLIAKVGGQEHLGAPGQLEGVDNPMQRVSAAPQEDGAGPSEGGYLGATMPQQRSNGYLEVAPYFSRRR